MPLALAACGYPEFEFRRADSSTPAIDAALDSSVIDTGSPVIVDSEVDTTVIDTTVPAEDTGAVVPDSPPDTAVVDTAKADTKPDAGDTAVARGCALPHDFCADFDTAMSVGDGWTSTFGGGGGATALDTTRSTSSPKSLLATVGTSTVTASSMLVKSFTVASTTTTITAEADLYLESLTYSHSNALILFKVQRSSAGDGVALAVGASGLVLQTSGITFDGWSIPGVSAGKWFHVKVEAVLHTSAGVARVYLDGASTPAVSRTGVSTAEVDDTTRQLLVGVFGYMGSVPFRVSFDDVSYDVP